MTSVAQTVTARNKAVKKLLQLTYPGEVISVTAGRGTAYHWIYIKFARTVRNPPGMLHNRVDDAIADLIVGAGIQVSRFPASDDGTSDKMLPCINLTMPRQRSV